MIVLTATLVWHWCVCAPHTAAELNACRGSTVIAGTLPACKTYRDGRSIYWPNHH